MRGLLASFGYCMETQSPGRPSGVEQVWVLVVTGCMWMGAVPTHHWSPVGPLTLNFDSATWHFLNSTSYIGLF